MGKLVEQLQKHIDEVGEERFAEEIFEIHCKMSGIDPKSKNAKRKLAWKNFKTRLRFTILPRVWYIIKCIFAVTWWILCGINLVFYDWLTVGICAFFGLCIGVGVIMEAFRKVIW